MANPIFPDPSTEGPSSQENVRVRPVDRIFESKDEIRHVAKMLAEHGGGAVAFDLALDLLLNEIVEQARIATGANGAAIALTRDGEMVCRATSGANAPDLGVRVESQSGLSGACLKTGEVQNCSDTETDARVDAAFCRNLGVRSIMIAPVAATGEGLGILEVLSSRPNAFGENDIKVLQQLAQRIAKNKIEADEGMQAADFSAEVTDDSALEEERSFEGGMETDEGGNFPEVQSKPTEFWSTLLLILVVLTAISLGSVIGWRSATRGATKAGSQATLLTAPRINPTHSASPGDQKVATTHEEPTTSQIAPTGKGSRVPLEPGGMVVTENGKVIYRVPPAPVVHSPASSAGSDRVSNRLIHRIYPQYPPEARDKGIQGSVVLDALIQGDGRVGDVTVVSGDPMLSEAAVRAVKQWIFQPLTSNAKPAERQTRITVRFTLPPK